MAEKIVKARKNYKCAFCESVIKKGDAHKHGKVRAPKFDDDHETQIGIEYAEWRLCIDVVNCNSIYSENNQSYLNPIN